MKKEKSFTENFIDTSNIDLDLFDQSCEKIIGIAKGLNGIGTLSEKTVHAVLKYYYGPNENWHEIRIGSYVADICREGEIYEIQSKSFYLMKKKLAVFLQEHEVTIVYPVALKKILRYVDPETGEISSGRISSKKGHIYDIVDEMYSIREFLSYDNLHFIVCFIEMEEYKLLDGWSKDKKKGATKTDRIPTRLIGEYSINSIKDLRNLLPENLPEQFTAKDVAKSAKSSIDSARMLINLLCSSDYLENVGYYGKSKLYRII